MKQPGFRIAWTTLILCLCFGSLVILPLLNFAGPSILEVYEIETDEDDSIVTTIDTAVADLFFIPFSPMTLDFQTASLSPVSPPPKHV